MLRGPSLLPGGFGVDFKSGQANTPIGSTIDRLDFNIAHNVVAGFTLLGKKASAGSHALAHVLRAVFDIGLNKHARFIEGRFNHGTDGWSPVERFVRINFGARVELPRLVARNMPTVNWLEVLPVLIEAHKAGLLSREHMDAFIRKVTFAPPPTATPTFAAPSTASQSTPDLNAIADQVIAKLEERGLSYA